MPADYLRKIEAQYGRSDRVWIMGRVIPAEETLESMRDGDHPVQCLVGAPKGRLTKLKRSFAGKSRREVRYSMEVKLLYEDGDLHILAKSRPRMLKERGLRRQRLKALWSHLHELRGQSLKRD